MNRVFRSLGLTEWRWPACKSRIVALALPFLCLLGSSACNRLDTLLEVELPGNVTVEDLENPALASTLVLGAQGSFECGYSDAIEWYGYWSGDVWGTQLNRPEGFASQRAEQYAIYADPCGSTTGPTWTPIQASRVAAEAAVAAIDGWVDAGISIPNSSLLLGKAYLYAGYSYLLLSEAFCQVAFDLGPLQSRGEGFALAEQRFSSAIQHASLATGSEANDILNAATVGRARARLNLGDTQGVIDDASVVPGDFWFWATYDDSPNRRQNNLQERFEGRAASVPENLKNPDIGGVPDPRTPAEPTGLLGGDSFTPHWNQKKYSSRASEIPLATGREAQLMLAEATGGQTAVGIINNLRAAVEDLPWVTPGGTPLPPFASTDPAEIEATLHEERRRELWLHGTRLGDMLRWGEPFATGTDHRGRAFFDGTCMPLPDLERFGNPSIPNN